MGRDGALCDGFSSSKLFELALPSLHTLREALPHLGFLVKLQQKRSKHVMRICVLWVQLYGASVERLSLLQLA